MPVHTPAEKAKNKRAAARKLGSAVKTAAKMSASGKARAAAVKAADLGNNKKKVR